MALTEAARGASALGEIADDALRARPPPGRAASRSPCIAAVLRAASEADPREHLPYAAAVELVERLRALGASRGLSPRDVLHPLRIALTGAPHGLPLPVVVAVLSRAEALERCRT